MTINEYFLNYIISWQEKLNNLLSNLFNSLETGNISIYISILLVSFIYGLIHALGPGHGKVIIASYFLTKGGKIKEAFKAGFLTSFIHAVNALLITTILYFFFKSTISKYFNYINENMYKVSAIFVLFIASFLLYEAIKDNHKEEEVQNVSNKNILTIATSIGIVPCPGVMSIVLYTMILGYFKLGILSAIFMSIGMGLSISFSAIISSKIRKKTNFKNPYFFKFFNYLGIVFLFCIGIILIS